MSQIKKSNDLVQCAWNLDEARCIATKLIPFAPRDCKARDEDHPVVVDFGRYGSGADFTCERGWGISGKVSVRMRVGKREKLEDCEVQYFVPTIEINWSCTGRTVASALASIALYQELTNFAALMESRLTLRNRFTAYASSTQAGTKNSHH